ncbi:MAG: acyl-CoA dehydrogenase family protein [Jatrophihabitans sp.]|uniref:acyl-CoA dehydrogenase family protein n=1 Tax=Jatrophihabitans sp. TaxID=1932789 RepID=UPI003F8043A9
MATTDDERALVDAVRGWARRRQPTALVHAQADGAERRREVWAELVGLGVVGAALPESIGGGGLPVTALAVLLEATAAELAPGPVLTTALAGLVFAAAGDPAAALVAEGTPVGVALDGSELVAEPAADGVVVRGRVRRVLGAAADGLLLLPLDGDDWAVVPTEAAGVKLLDLDAVDLSRPLAEVHLDRVPARVLSVPHERVRDLAVTLAAAEASGVASQALRVAVEYAKVRQQFGEVIGRFQAVKHLCAQMACRAEVASVVAWDAASSVGDNGHAVSAAVAGALALDAGVDVAKDAIQVLGGIGFTWEHDAHLYLRRALALRQWLGGGSVWRQRVARLTAAGARRELRIELGAAETQRAQVRAEAERVASLPESERRAALVESAWLVPHWSPPYGLGADAAHQLLIDQELDRVGVARPDLVIAGWAVPTIIEHGTDAQRERFVRPTLLGELTWCQLFSEPEAGSDLAALRTRAVKVDGGWRLTGQKVWTSLAHRADYGICLARTDPDAPKHKGISYFLVDMRAEGVDIRPLREIVGEPRFNEVWLDDVFVPDDLLVGQPGDGWRLARTTLAHERVAIGGGSSLGEDLERLVARAASDGLLADGAVADRLGGVIANGLAGSLLDLRSALASLAGRSPGAESSVRKLVGVTHRQTLAELALELSAADGLVRSEVSDEMLVTRCLSIAGGTTQVLLSLVGERLLGLPR